MLVLIILKLVVLESLKKMKLPKSKTGLYVVERHINGETEGVPIAVWLTEESADNYAGACEQEFKEKGIYAYVFRTHYVTFYNE